MCQGSLGRQQGRALGRRPGIYQLTALHTEEILWIQRHLNTMKTYLDSPLKQALLPLQTSSAPAPHRNCPFCWTMKSKMYFQRHEPAESWKQEGDRKDCFEQAETALRVFSKYPLLLFSGSLDIALQQMTEGGKCLSWK